ncbi:MAG: hypothetical protein JWL79_3378 [Frankiales bacterium]|nr:hypothetical protein [Frankiales bacterium]
MRRGRTARALLAAGAFASLLSAGPGHAAAPNRPALLPACAYGTSAPGVSGFAARVERDAWSYADRQPGDAPTRSTTARAFAAAEVAYVYGLPLVEVHDTIRQFRFRNTTVSIAELTTAASRRVVSPNVDTLYTVGWLSLAQQPLVLDVPDTGGRFYTFQLMDGWTNSFAYLGSGSTGTRAGSYLLTPPGWRGTVPPGVHLVRSPTRTVWLLGRTLVDGAADLPKARPVLQHYTATPLAAWVAGVRGRPVVFDKAPPAQAKPATPAGGDFISTLNRQLVLDPPPADQTCVLDALAPAGVQRPSSSALAVQAADAADVAGDPSASPLPAPDPAVTAGTAAAVRLIADAARTYRATTSTGRAGWSVMTDPWIGDFGRQYLGRAIIATDLLGANVPRIAVYPTSYADRSGRPLTGRSRYTITFPKGQLPPVKAFWSLTMYQSDNFLYANNSNRYAVGDRTGGLRYGKDGSLTLYVQHDPPASVAQRANWLPAPVDAFHLILRLYLPKSTALNGAYRIPPLVRAD